jgi:hypothetical protein
MEKLSKRSITVSVRNATYNDIPAGERVCGGGTG